MIDRKVKKLDSGGQLKLQGGEKMSPIQLSNICRFSITRQVKLFSSCCLGDKTKLLQSVLFTSCAVLEKGILMLQTSF